MKETSWFDAYMKAIDDMRENYILSLELDKRIIAQEVLIQLMERVQGNIERQEKYE
jgi:hypothetical protein